MALEKSTSVILSLPCFPPSLSECVLQKKKKPTISNPLSFNTWRRKRKRKGNEERRKAKSIMEKEFNFLLCQVLRLLSWKSLRITNSYFPS